MGGERSFPSTSTHNYLITYKCIEKIEFIDKLNKNREHVFLNYI